MIAQCLLLRIDCRRAKTRHPRREGVFNMRAIFGAFCLVVTATAAWAGPCVVCQGPAPLLGLGIPAAVAVAGALLGTRFLKKK
jgi:hypothetical protein